MREVSEQNKKALLKKWRSNLTKYTKLQNNNWIKISQKGNINIKKDFSEVKHWYLNEIEKAHKIINHLTK